jgi:hypothetical protein
VRVANGVTKTGTERSGYLGAATGPEDVVGMDLAAVGTTDRQMRHVSTTPITC